MPKLAETLPGGPGPLDLEKEREEEKSGGCWARTGPPLMDAAEKYPALDTPQASSRLHKLCNSLRFTGYVHQQVICPLNFLNTSCEILALNGVDFYFTI